VAKAVALAAQGGEKADGPTVSKREEKQAVGASRKTLNEARLVSGVGHKLRGLPQHERRFGKQRSPKSEQPLGIACGGAANENTPMLHGRRSIRFLRAGH